jgi:hypothetical protein
MTLEHLERRQAWGIETQFDFEKILARLETCKLNYFCDDKSCFALNDANTPHRVFVKSQLSD